MFSQYDWSPVGTFSYIVIAVAILILYEILITIRLAYRSDLASLRSPSCAKFTSFYRVCKLW